MSWMMLSRWSWRLLDPKSKQSSDQWWGVWRVISNFLQTYSNSTLKMPVNLPSLYWSLSAINVQPRMLPHGFSGNFWYSYFLQDPNHVQTWHIRRYYRTNSVERVLMSQHLCGKDWKRVLVAPVVIVCYSGDLAESISRQWGPLVCLPKRTSAGTLKMKKRALTATAAKILFV